MVESLQLKQEKHLKYETQNGDESYISEYCNVFVVEVDYHLYHAYISASSQIDITVTHCILRTKANFYMHLELGMH